MFTCITLNIMCSPDNEVHYICRQSEALVQTPTVDALPPVRRLQVSSIIKIICLIYCAHTKPYCLLMVTQ